MSTQAQIWGQSWAEADDVTLLGLVRGGDAEAYAELWRRHLPAAYAVAHRHRGRTSAEDVVAEASLRVYDLIQAGKGPLTNFRSYFLSAVRTIAVDHARGELRAVPTEDAALETASPATAAYDPSPGVDHALVRVAFARLAERDQQVLWRTAVEGTTPAAVADDLGLSANGVSVIALRARDSLRAKYLDAHADRAISRAQDEECRWVLAQMGRFVRGKLPVRQRARVEDHLRSCRLAQGLAYEMAEVNRALPAVMVPLIFLAGSSVAGTWAGAAGAAGAASVTAGGPRGRRQGRGRCGPGDEPRHQGRCPRSRCRTRHRVCCRRWPRRRGGRCRGRRGRCWCRRGGRRGCEATCCRRTGSRSRRATGTDGCPFANGSSLADFRSLSDCSAGPHCR
ncbi:MAG: sigma-70 family RNA polymerase sigma factor [Dermatophilaceae bacterium]